MNIAEKTLRLKQDFDDVFEAGKKAEYDGFWDMFQDGGNRTNYTGAFRDWTATTINPKYPIRTTSLYEIFSNCGKLEALPELISANENGAFNSCYTAFQMCLKLKSIDIDVINSATASSAWTSTFRYCQELVSIKKLGVLESQPFNRTFDYCVSLENITIDGTIGQNGFDIHWSTRLSADSLESIINALSTTTTGLTITLPSVAESNYDTEKDAGAWNTLVATRSNWTIAYA